MSDQDFVLAQTREHVTILTLNEPAARNPLSPMLIARLAECLVEARDDDDVRVVILHGAGKGFSAGADLRRMRSAAPMEDREEYNDILVVNRMLWAFPKPTIAAVHGFALGAGANLMSWCDIAVAEQTAKVGYPEVRAGVPSATVIPTLMRTVGRKAMLELILTGSPISADEALRIGLVTRVVPDGGALSAAEELAATIAANNPSAVQLTKEMVRVTTDMAYQQAIEYAKELRIISRLRKDFHVEIAAGGSGRTP